MENNRYLGKRMLATVSLTVLVLSGCALTNSISNGSLENGVSYSSTNEFSFSVPVYAVVHDGLHPLGGWVAVRNLAKPIFEKAVSYNRIALPENEITLEKSQGMIKSGHDFWLRGNTSRALEHIIYNEWIETDSGAFYFSIIEGPDEGLVVKPGGYYGTLSFIRGNYSYVLSEYIDAPYQLKGSEDSDERTRIKDSNVRLKSINKYLDNMEFKSAEKIQFPLK